MRPLAVLICLELLAACGGLPPAVPPPSIVTRALRAEPDRVWGAARDVLREEGHEIQRQDAAHRVLETDWLAINPDYSANVLVTGQEDRYSQCGKPRLGQAFRGKEVRLRVQVSPSVKTEETALTVQATFRTGQYLGLPMAIGALRAHVFCPSTGWLENELAVRIQLAALGGLDRLRRGGSR
jgi:hypothetical protein